MDEGTNWIADIKRNAEAAIILKEELNKRGEYPKHVGVTLAPDTDATDEEIRANLKEALDEIEKGNYDDLPPLNDSRRGKRA